MLDYMQKSLINLMRPINTTVTVLLGLLTFFWGLWVLCPEWSVFGSADVYMKMEDFAPEWAWGTWSLVAGALQVVAALREDYKFLAHSLEFIAWHWFVVALAMWVGDWQNTGGLVYTTVCLYSVFSYLNVKLNYIGIDPDVGINRVILRYLQRHID